MANCVHALSGKQIWTGRVNGNYVASPLVANGFVYFFNEEGTTTVVREQDTFEIVHRNDLTEGMRASPAVAQGSLYLRTFGHLYRIRATDG